MNLLILLLMTVIALFDIVDSEKDVPLPKIPGQQNILDKVPSLEIQTTPATSLRLIGLTPANPEQFNVITPVKRRHDNTKPTVKKRQNNKKSVKNIEDSKIVPKTRVQNRLKSPAKLPVKKNFPKNKSMPKNKSVSLVNRRKIKSKFPGKKIVPKTFVVNRRIVKAKLPGKKIVPKTFLVNRRKVKAKFPAKKIVPKRFLVNRKKVKAKLPVKKILPGKKILPVKKILPKNKSTSSVNRRQVEANLPNCGEEINTNSPVKKWVPTVKSMPYSINRSEVNTTLPVKRRQKKNKKIIQTNKSISPINCRQVKKIVPTIKSTYQLNRRQVKPKLPVKKIILKNKSRTPLKVIKKIPVKNKSRSPLNRRKINKKLPVKKIVPKNKLNRRQVNKKLPVKNRQNQKKKIIPAKVKVNGKLSVKMRKAKEIIEKHGYNKVNKATSPRQVKTKLSVKNRQNNNKNVTTKPILIDTKSLAREKPLIEKYRKTKKLDKNNPANLGNVFTIPTYLKYWQKQNNPANGKQSNLKLIKKPAKPGKSFTIPPNRRIQNNSNNPANGDINPAPLGTFLTIRPEPPIESLKNPAKGNFKSKKKTNKRKPAKPGKFFTIPPKNRIQNNSNGNLKPAPQGKFLTIPPNRQIQNNSNNPANGNLKSAPLGKFLTIPPNRRKPPRNVKLNIPVPVRKRQEVPKASIRTKEIILDKTFSTTQNNLDKSKPITRKRRGTLGENRISVAGINRSYNLDKSLSRKGNLDTAYPADAEYYNVGGITKFNTDTVRYRGYNLKNRKPFSSIRQDNLDKSSLSTTTNNYGIQYPTDYDYYYDIVPLHIRR